MTSHKVRVQGQAYTEDRAALLVKQGHLLWLWAAGRDSGELVSSFKRLRACGVHSWNNVFFQMLLTLS